jgi:hypothetical protein
LNPGVPRKARITLRGWIASKGNLKAEKAKHLILECRERLELITYRGWIA